jgi:hypothetical protein
VSNSCKAVQYHFMCVDSAALGRGNSCTAAGILVQDSVLRADQVMKQLILFYRLLQSVTAIVGVNIVQQYSWHCNCQ